MSDDLAERFRTAPVDPVSARRLAEEGLDYRTVPHDDAAAGKAWLHAVRRGFLDGEATPEHVADALSRSGYRRLTGVYDADAPDPLRPVATIASWVSELTVPGRAVIPSCAISAVTVAPTHRRRGIARAMLEGELRTAAASGVPMAMLTVSESPLYGRYGFAPAASSASLVLDVKRARWIGRVPAGRIDFVSRDRWRELVPALHDRIRIDMPGEIAMPPSHWDRFARIGAGAKDAEQLRAVQYRDDSGEVQGLTLYTVQENPDDFTKSSVDLLRLDAATDDAYAALWRFFVELDLIGEVRASELSVDEPVLWMIDDRRAATVTVQDHQYLRILDVPAVLRARRYDGSTAGIWTVDDPLGIAGGEWTMEVSADGAGYVIEGARAPDRARLGIRELSAAYLGGVSLVTLAAATGTVTTQTIPAGRPGDPGVLGAALALAWHQTPRLSFWY